MTKFEKLIDKLLRKPKDMRFNEVRTILEKYGFENARTKVTSSLPITEM